MISPFPFLIESDFSLSPSPFNMRGGGRIADLSRSRQQLRRKRRKRRGGKGIQPIFFFLVSQFFMRENPSLFVIRKLKMWFSFSHKTCLFVYHLLSPVSAFFRPMRGRGFNFLCRHPDSNRVAALLLPFQS